ncbi:MAG: six-hairpin glycosidase [Prevotellaceae bacterium]|nr:six-hairpin glycosidase [Prevotellaceae bacterium]
MNLKILHKILVLSAAVSFACSLSAKILYETHPQTGAISRLSVANDARGMSWIVETDGSQYKWINEDYGWGLGFFSVVANGDTLRQRWKTPQSIQPGKSTYALGDVSITVTRRYNGGDLVEEYLFTNTGKQPLRLFDVGIYTPFNDNYPDAATCYTSRVHAHIWAGEHAAYVNATHMSGQSPHLGLVVVKGAIASYEICERAMDKAMSNTRGVIALNPEAMALNPGQRYALSWRIFSHHGHEDFFAKALSAGSVIARSDRYVYSVGKTASVTFECGRKLKDARATVNGESIPLTQSGNTYIASAPVTRTGNMRVELHYNEGMKTHVELLAVSDEKKLVKKRAEFIVRRQQLNNPADKRDGAYMVYDNEENKIFMNDKPSVSYLDRDEGAERVGMGVFLALHYLQGGKDEALKASLIKYAGFIRQQLQDSSYNTWSTVEHKGRNRAYNYPWIADFYLRMFQVTGNRQFLSDAYGTLRAMFRHFGHGFYAIGIPVQLSVALLRDEQMTAEADTLLNDFKKAGENYLKNGVHYPTHEVNYEQSIVAPAIITLTQLYLVTGEQRFLDGATLQLPLLEAFGGLQPSYHLNGIAIRHWDGYWFGKREMWGDTFPHYWSTLSAVAYDLYARCTGNASYRTKALNIVRNNLCLFFENGKASCAYLYPRKVNGVEAQFYDPYANDQDWAMAYYLNLIESES